MKVTVAGGTGFLGRYISQALLDDGHEVTVLSRSPESVGRIQRLAGVNATKGDVTDPSSLRGRFEGAEAVVMCVQFPNYPIEQPRKGLTFDRYDRQGTENLLQEAERSGVGRFVYLSGVGSTPTSDKSWYRAKGRAEVSIREASLQHAIVRPSWAYGPEDKALNKFRQLARFLPVVPKPGTKVQRIQPVFVEDIALTVRRIFQRDDAWDRTYEIGGPEVLTMDQVIEGLLDAMGKRKPIVSFPLALAKLGTAPLVVLPTPPMSPGGVEFAVQDGLADNTEVRKFLEIEPIPFREGLARYIRP